MSAIIGALRGLLSLDTAAFDSGARRGIATMGKVERSMVRMGDVAQRQGRRLSVGLTLPIVGAAAAMVKSSLSIIDSQAKMAQSLDTSVRSMQVLQRAADLSGVSMGEAQQATLQFTKRLSQASGGTGAAAKALDRLNLSAEDLLRLPLDERLTRVQDALARYVPEAERAAVASDLFGSRAGLVFSRIDGAALRLATDDVTRFGVAVSEVDADQIERTNDAISRLGLVGRGIANQLTVALAPALEGISDKMAGVAEWFNGLSDGSKELVAVTTALTAAVGPVVLGLGLVLKLAAPLVGVIAALASPLGLAAAGFTALAVAGTALAGSVSGSVSFAEAHEIAMDNVTVAMGDQFRATKRLADALREGGPVTLAAIEAEMSEAEALRATTAELVRKRQEKELEVLGYFKVLEAIGQYQERLSSLRTPGDDLEQMPLKLRSAYEEAEQGLVALLAEQKRLLEGVRSQNHLTKEEQANLEQIEANIAELKRRWNELNGITSENVELTDRGAASARDLALGLGDAAGQAAAVKSYLSGLPGALAGADAKIAGLKAGIAALSGGGTELSANVAKYRAELEASLPPLHQMADGQRRVVEEGINQQVQQFELQQRLNGEFQKGLSALNKVSAAGGSASKSALAQLRKEIQQRQSLIGLTDEQRKKLEAVLTVQQRLGKEAQAVSKAQVSGLADQLIALDEAEAATRRIAEQQERWAENITRTAFEGGSLTDTMKGVLRDIAYQFAHTKVVLPIVGQVTGVLGLDKLVLGGGSAQAAGGGLLGGGSGLLGNILNAGGLFSGAGAGIASGLGGIFTGGGLGASFANLGGLVTGASAGWGALGAALPALGIIAGGIAILAKGLSRKYKGSGLGGAFTPDGLVEGHSFDFYKGGWFRSDKWDRKPLELEYRKALDAAMKGLSDGVLGMADTLNLGTKALDKFEKANFTIWTNGKSQEEIQQALQDEMEKTAEQMAELILGTSKWSKAGETATATLSRLSTSLLQVNDAADLLGLSGFRKSLKGADMASGLIDEFGGSDAMASAISAYWTGFYSDAERQKTSIRRLAREFKKLGLQMPKSREEFRGLVEGIDLTSAAGRKLYADLLELSGGLSQVLDPRAGVSEKVAKQLEKVGKTVADQIEVSRSLAADARASAELWHRTASKLQDFQDGLLSSGLSGASNAQAAAAMQSRYLAALERARNGDADAAAELPSLARDYLQSARESAASALEFNRIAAGVQAQLSQIEALADAKGAADEKLASLLDEQTQVLTDLGAYLQTAEAGTKEFDRNIAKYQKKLGALGADIVEASENPGVAEVSPTGGMSKLFTTLTGGLSGVKSPMNALTRMLGKLRDTMDQERKERQRNQKIAGLQVKGVDAVALSEKPQEVADKFNALRQEYGISLVGQKGSVSVGKDGRIVTSFDYYGGTADNLKKFKEALSDEFGTASFGNVVKSTNTQASKAEVQADKLREQIRSLGEVPQFADGGAHLGGWRIVGERGWELENTGPSRVVSHSDSVAMLDNRKVVASVESLAKQVGLQGQRLEMLVRKVAQYLEDWDEVGQPEVRP